MWMWLTAEFALNDPPLTYDGHMSIEISPLHIYVTFFVGTGNKLEKARCRVNLTHKQNMQLQTVVGSFNGY